MVYFYLTRSSFRKYSQFKSTVNLPNTAFPLIIKQKAKHEAELREVTGLFVVYVLVELYYFYF